MLLSLALIAPASVPGPALAQDQASVSGAPVWVTLGTQLSYHVATATMGGDGGTRLVEDPNGPLTDPASGKRYREEWTGGTLQGGSGAEGIAQTTVLGVVGTDVVVARTGLLRDALSGTYQPMPASAERAPGTSVAGAWRHPDELAALRTGNAGADVQVLRGDIAFAGANHPTVTLVRAVPGDYAAFWYDATTGQLLQSAIRSGGNGTSTSMMTTELTHVRQLPLPGIGTAVPEALLRGAPLAYQGMLALSNPMDPNQPAMSLPAAQEVRLQERGDTWTIHQVTTDSGTGGAPTRSTSVSGGAGPYWWAPAALAAMTEGQILDQDPATGQTQRVSAVGQGPFGQTVTIASSMPGLEAAASYDVATGVLVEQSTTSSASGLSSHFALQQLP